MNATDTDTLLSPQQLADWLNVPISTVYRWRQMGDGPPSFRVGRHVRYRESECLAWLEDQRQPAAS